MAPLAPWTCGASAPVQTGWGLSTMGGRDNVTTPKPRQSECATEESCSGGGGFGAKQKAVPEGVWAQLVSSRRIIPHDNGPIALSTDRVEVHMRIGGGGGGGRRQSLTDRFRHQRSCGRFGQFSPAPSPSRSPRTQLAAFCGLYLERLLIRGSWRGTGGSWGVTGGS